MFALTCNDALECLSIYPITLSVVARCAKNGNQNPKCSLLRTAVAIPTVTNIISYVCTYIIENN